MGRSSLKDFAFRVGYRLSAYLTSHFEVEALAQAVHSNVSLVPRSYECDCRLSAVALGGDVLVPAAHCRV